MPAKFFYPMQNESFKVFIIITVIAPTTSGLTDFNASPQSPAEHDVVTVAETKPLIKPSVEPSRAAKPSSFNCSSSTLPFDKSSSRHLYISGAVFRTKVIVAAVSPALIP